MSGISIIVPTLPEITATVVSETVEVAINYTTADPEFVHNDLNGRSDPDAHPQSAISGLLAALALKAALLSPGFTGVPTAPTAALHTNTTQLATTAFAFAEAAAAQAASQPLDADLTAIAALTTTAFGRGLLTATSGDAIAGLNASQLLGQTWAAPGAIGGTTPAAVSCTALSTAGGHIEAVPTYGTAGSPAENKLTVGAIDPAGQYSAGVYAVNSFQSNLNHWLRFKTCNAGSTLTALTLSPDGTATFINSVSCTTLTFGTYYTLAAGGSATSAKLISGGASNYWQMSDSGNNTLGFVGFTAASDFRVYNAAGSIAQVTLTDTLATFPGVVSCTTLNSTAGYVHAHKAVSNSFLAGPCVTVENVAGDKVGAMQLGTATLDFWVYESSGLKALSLNRSTGAATFLAGITGTGFSAASGTGSISCVGDNSPYMTFSDGTNTTYLQVASGRLDCTCAANKAFSISGGGNIGAPGTTEIYLSDGKGKFGSTADGCVTAAGKITLKSALPGSFADAAAAYAWASANFT